MNLGLDYAATTRMVWIARPTAPTEGRALLRREAHQGRFLSAYEGVGKRPFVVKARRAGGHVKRGGWVSNLISTLISTSSR